MSRRFDRINAEAEAARLFMRRFCRLQLLSYPVLTFDWHIVPKTSHLAVTSDARSGVTDGGTSERVLIAQSQ